MPRACPPQAVKESADRRAKKERKKRREARIKARIRAAEMAKGEPCVDDMAALQDGCFPTVAVGWDDGLLAGAPEAARCTVRHYSSIWS